MISLEELKIEHMIVHILDSQLSIPVISTAEMPSSYETKEFFMNHIHKVINGEDIKKCVFDEEYNVFLSNLKNFIADETQFVPFSIQTAQQLFAIMSTNIEIPSADLAVVTFKSASQPFLALLKMNYQSTYIHYTDYEEDANINTILLHRTTLPNPSQKINEAIIIDLTTMDIQILEKSYPVNGEKTFYFSKLFLKCHAKMSSKEQMAIVKHATQKVAKKFFDEDMEKKMHITEELFQQIDDSGNLNLETFAKDVFKANAEIKEAFMEALEQKGLDTPIVTLNEKTISRSFENQRLKTDNGIELKIPMALYNDPTKMEFITNPDGKISILIKDITKISQ